MNSSSQRMMTRASEVEARLGSMIAVQCLHPNVLVVLQLSYLDASNNNVVGTLPSMWSSMEQVITHCTGTCNA